MAYYLAAVDVGTASARAGIFDRTGRSLARAECPFVLYHGLGEHAEYCSGDIWEAVTTAVRAGVRDAGIRAGEVAGISFDATCSLVACDSAGRPVSVSRSSDDRRDTIVWHDHRAMAEAAECTATGHRVLDHLGGVMSPEMQIPKLMWLKRNLPESWSRFGLIFDLADYLTFRASGSVARSQSTLACKWTYLAHRDPGWQADFLASVGLDDLIARAGLPARAVPAGSDLGPLTRQAAADLGLSTACRVGAGLVDAYAGALGVMAPLCGDPGELAGELALIAGTSSCVMVQGAEPVRFGGSWGPYFGVILPGLWVSEGGQSVSGALLDHILRWHGAGGEPTPALHERVIARIGELRRAEGADFAARLHVVPDFHGNRSPLADPELRGVIGGLSFETGFDSLCALYWRTAVGIALGIRHILDDLRMRGHAARVLRVAGGHLHNPLLMELYADATGCEVVTPETPSAVLLGTAMIAAVAAGCFPDIATAARAMQAGVCRRQPEPAARRRFDDDYRVFLTMVDQRRDLEVQRRGRPRFAGKGLIIFDCDGVVVDSEILATEVLARLLAERGVDVPLAELTLTVLGCSAGEVKRRIEAKWGVRIGDADADGLQQRLFALFHERLEPINGIAALLDGLRQPFCLASSSGIGRIEVALASSGLTTRFAGRIFNAAMVARGKPEPDLFLLAAHRMGFGPRDCLVIEDSPAGVTAARRAGMDVIAFTGGSHAGGADFRARLAALGPDAISDSMAEIAGWLEHDDKKWS